MMMSLTSGHRPTLFLGVLELFHMLLFWLKSMIWMMLFSTNCLLSLPERRLPVPVNRNKRKNLVKGLVSPPVPANNVISLKDQRKPNTFLELNKTTLLRRQMFGLIL